MKKRSKINKKRLIIFIVIAVLIIGIVVAATVKLLNKDNKDITLDGTDQTIEGNNMTNNQEIEYDGNPYNVPQDYTETVNEFVNESGEVLDENTLSEVKQNITDKFKQLPTDKLGINTDMSNIRIVFNQGTTKVADSTCLVFVVYEEKDNSLNFISKYAMSIDTNIVYKYDSTALIYNMIEL